MAEPTRPDVARVYDFFLGGSHNFEVDRQAAQGIMKLFPETPQIAQLNRYFLFYFIETMLARGLKKFLDLATGLPTEGHIHDWIPPDAHVVYNDHSAEVVEMARAVIGDRPNVRYVLAKVENIREILEVATEHLGSNEPTAISGIGFMYFLDDLAVQEFARTTYDWAGPDSRLGVSSLPSLNKDDPKVQEGIKFYERMGTTLYHRTPQHLAALLQPWQLIDGGFKPFESYPLDYGRLKVSYQHDALRGQLGFAGVLAKKAV